MLVTEDMISMLQAAWIINDTDDEESGTDEEVDDMVMDETESGHPGEEGNHSDLSEDEASLDLRDSDGETDADSVMMVSFDMYIQVASEFYCVTSIIRLF